jgi:predicted transcriptional regulator
VKTKPDPELARWCRDLATYTGVTDVVPPNWYTSSQIAKAYGRSVVTLSKHLKAQVESGKAERKTFRIQCDKTVRPVPHYRLK